MFMTTEKIEPVTTFGEEHPAFRAARMIRDLHLENIALINSGTVFLREGVDVSGEMKASCEKQIKLCDEIMERSKNMDPSHWSPALLLCREVQEMIGREAAERNALKNAPEGSEQEVLGSVLPEIGNYGHG